MGSELTWITWLKGARRTGSLQQLHQHAIETYHILLEMTDAADPALAQTLEDKVVNGWAKSDKTLRPHVTREEVSDPNLRFLVDTVVCGDIKYETGSSILLRAHTKRGDVVSSSDTCRFQ